MRIRSKYLYVSKRDAQGGGAIDPVLKALDDKINSSVNADMVISVNITIDRDPYNGCTGVSAIVVYKV